MYPWFLFLSANLVCNPILNLLVGLFFLLVCISFLWNQLFPEFPKGNKRQWFIYWTPLLVPDYFQQVKLFLFAWDLNSYRKDWPSWVGFLIQCWLSSPSRVHQKQSLCATFNLFDCLYFSTHTMMCCKERGECQFEFLKS